MNHEILLKKLISVLKDGIHVIDQEGRTVLYNRKMAVIENRLPDDVIGKPLAEICSERDHSLLRVLETGLPLTDKIYTGINKFGNQVVTNNSVWPITDRGRITGAVEIAVDITQQRKLQGKVLGVTKDISHLVKKEVSRSGGKRWMTADIIGESSEMENVKRIARLAGQCDANVLVIGSSGTGKEMIAQSIHNESRRRDKPLIAENCAAIPESLLESAFFGTVKGGFTGAVDRPGLFQLADGGTLILDEINSLPIGLQAKLLRVLQEGVFRPVGSGELVSVDVRVIAITNEDPEVLIQNEKLRADLFYRISVVDIYVPELLERGRDLDLLAAHFLEQFSRRSRKDVAGFSDQVRKAFWSYPWKGNVRELSNVIECGVNLTEEGELIELSSLPSYFVKHCGGGIAAEPRKSAPKLSSGNLNLIEYLSELERSMVRDALKQADGNVSKAAETLGITRQALQHKLRKMGL